MKEDTLNTAHKSLKRISKQTFAKRGFTIVELVVVIVVIGILASVVYVSYKSITDSNLEERVKVAAQAAGVSLGEYKTSNGSYPGQVSDAGVVNSADVMYQYTSDSAVGSYCTTATSGAVSMYVTDKTLKPVSGVCSGHGPNGKPFIYNEIQDPNVTSLSAVLPATGPKSTTVLMTNGGYSGSTYARRSFTAADTGGGFSLGASGGAQIPIVYGNTYTFSAWLRSNSLRSMYVQVSANAAVAGSPAISIGPAWTRIAFTVKIPRGDLGFPPPTAASMSVLAGTGISSNGSWLAGDYLDVDAVMVTEGDVVYNFKDGFSPGCSWLGSPNASRSKCVQD